MAQTRAFSIIGPSLWNQLLPSTRSTLTGEPLQVPLFVLSRLLSSLWVSSTGSASDSCALQEALCKCILYCIYCIVFIHSCSASHMQPEPFRSTPDHSN